MREHKNNKNPRKTHSSVDGIISDGRSIGVPTHKSYSPNRGPSTPSLGSSANASDGFHPSRQSGYSLGGSPEDEETTALMDEPIMLDDIDEDNKPRRRLHKKKSKSRKFFKKTFYALLILILAAGAYFGYKFYTTQHDLLAGGGKAPAVCNANVRASELKGEGDGRVNILILGNGGPEHTDGPDLTDTIIVASIDTINNKAALLSIPRDLWVKIPDVGSKKINEAYYWGKQESDSKNTLDKSKDGIANVDKTLEDVIGVPIHYHILVDFAAFRSTVDAVGGLDINVPADLAVSDRLWDEHTGKNYYLNVKPGLQHFDGQKALFFARSRYTSSGGDFDRSARQRLVIVSLKDKAKSVSTLSNPIKVSNLLDSLGSNVYTDFDSASLKCIYKKINQIPSSQIKSLDLVTPPNDFIAGDNIAGKSVQVPKAGLYDYNDIQAYVRNALRDSFIAKENSSIAVYNATSTTGLAAKKAADLKSYGYNITTVDNATVTNPSKTIIVDLTKGTAKYTRHYLEDRFGVTAQNTIPADLTITPPTGTNFVIILGQDAAINR